MEEFGSSLNDDLIKMKRVWKPLDVGGLRLYRVVVHRVNIDWSKELIVAAKRPMHAAELVEKCGYNPREYIIMAYPLNILMPETWWIDGIPKSKY